MNKFSLLTLSAATVFLLISCGEDSTSDASDTVGGVPENGSSVETIYDLGKCIPDREGDVIFVEEDSLDYLCKKGTWEELVSAVTKKSSSSKGKSSASEEKSSSSKGKSSASEKKSSSSSKGESSASEGKSSSSKGDSSASEEKSSSSKGNSSASEEKSSSSKGTSSASEEKSSSSKVASSSSKPETKSSSSSKKSSSSSIPESSSSVKDAKDTVKNVVISKKSFTGVAEKGPYTSGSIIRLIELDEDMDPTGTTFEWEVSSDLGAYTSPKVSLVNQYALFQANGYFYNENSAKRSTGQLTIKSLADLSGRSSANINVLGHLAHKRAIYLFTQSGSYSNFPAAKSAAEKEVLAAFGWGVNNHAFEDLSIYGSYEDDAKLLAASILLQGSLDDADLSSRLTSMTADFEADGLWNDSAAKVNIADWAMQTTRNYATTRSKLTAMNKAVPNFEKYIHIFVGTIYGLGVCNSGSDASMIKMTNAYSDNLGKTYVCDDERWRLPTSIETSLGAACTSNKNGSKVSGTSVDYICDGGAGNWRQMAVYDHKKGDYLSQDAHYGTLKDGRDGKTYKTVEIGLQTWMAENLNFYDEKNVNLVDNSWCYKNKKENCEVGGRLYSWTAAMDIPSSYQSLLAEALIETPHRGICPEGWHVPDTSEWFQLKRYVAKMEGYDGYTNDHSGQLKSQKGWTSYSTATRSSDAYGFSAIPTGAYYGSYADPSADYSRLIYDDAGYFANFWSSTETGKIRAAYWYLDYRYNYLDYYLSSYNQKDRGFSLRCVKN